jgi:hypothetical protein
MSNTGYKGINLKRYVETILWRIWNARLGDLECIR